MIKLCKILEVSSLKKKMLIQEFHNLFRSEGSHESALSVPPSLTLIVEITYTI